MEAPALNVPRRIGRYDIVGRLAQGGMAEILLARLTGPSGFERAVVIKRILPSLAAQPSFVDMFLDEGRLAARIRHPNVVQVQELSREDDDLYLVMEYLEGESAAGLLRRARARRMAIPPVLAAHVVAEAAAGLHAAHELVDDAGQTLGLVHRDISPQNLFIGYGGTVKVLDFGIAKAADRITRTEAGNLKGKFEYMSPEQAMGMRLDRRSDVFALGIVFYELLTGRRLFKRGTQVATLRAVTDDPIVPPSTVDPAIPSAFDAICMRALCRDVFGRPATALEMCREIATALRTLEGPAMPEEALSKLMHTLFEGRIREKREMLARMRDGVTPSHVPAADVDVAIELPSVDVEVGSEIRTKPITAADGASPRRRPLALLFGAVALAVVGLVALTMRLGSSPTTDAEPEPTSAASDLVAPNVELTVVSDPLGATIFVGDDERGHTPTILTLARGTEAVTVRLELEGHVPSTQVVVPDVDLRITASLSPRAEELSEAEEATMHRSVANRRRGAQMNESASMADETPDEAATDPNERERAFRRFN